MNGLKSLYLQLPTRELRTLVREKYNSAFMQRDSQRFRRVLRQPEVASQIEQDFLKDTINNLKLDIKLHGKEKSIRKRAAAY